MLQIIANKEQTYFEVRSINGYVGIIELVDGKYRTEYYDLEVTPNDILDGNIRDEFFEDAELLTVGTFNALYIAMNELSNIMLPEIADDHIFQLFLNNALKESESNVLVSICDELRYKCWMKESLEYLKDYSYQKECRLVAESYELEGDSKGAEVEYGVAKVLAALKDMMDFHDKCKSHKLA